MGNMHALRFTLCLSCDGVGSYNKDYSLVLFVVGTLSLLLTMVLIYNFLCCVQYVDFIRIAKAYYGSYFLVDGVSLQQHNSHSPQHM
jgi:hypothetical protein